MYEILIFLANFAGLLIWGGAETKPIKYLGMVLYLGTFTYLLIHVVSNITWY